MAADVFSNFRTNVLNIANGVPGLNGNVLGNPDFGANSNFFGNLNSGGAIGTLFVLPTEDGQVHYDFNGEFKVECMFFYGAPMNQNYDFTASDHVIANLVQLWTKYSEFVLGNTNGAFAITWPKPEARTDGPAGLQVWLTRLTISFKIVADQLTTINFITTNGQKVTTSNGALITTGG